MFTRLLPILIALTPAAALADNTGLGIGIGSGHYQAVTTPTGTVLIGRFVGSGGQPAGSGEAAATFGVWLCDGHPCPPRDTAEVSPFGHPPHPLSRPVSLSN